MLSWGRQNLSPFPPVPVFVVLVINSGMMPSEGVSVGKGIDLGETIHHLVDQYLRNGW